MKSITWTRPLGEIDPQDEELPPRDPDTVTTIERPAVTVEMLEQVERERTGPQRDSTEHRVLRRMSEYYADYGRRSSGRHARLSRFIGRN
jgi:hypothetical protein